MFLKKRCSISLHISTPSTLPIARRFPAALGSTERIGDRCPSIVHRCKPVRASQIRAELSAEPERTHWPPQMAKELTGRIVVEGRHGHGLNQRTVGSSNSQDFLFPFVGTSLASGPGLLAFKFRHTSGKSISQNLILLSQSNLSHRSPTPSHLA
jgi:hypothetical protein